MTFYLFIIADHSSFQECPVGTYKNVTGSYSSLCTPCPVDSLPNRADFIYIRGNSSWWFVVKYWCFFQYPDIECTELSIYCLLLGGVTQPPCPYKCISDKYKMPNCYTPLEELMYTFGGPWSFAIILSFTIILLALILSGLRIKIGESDITYRATNAINNDGCSSFPFLLSLAEVYFSFHSIYFLLLQAITE